MKKNTELCIRDKNGYIVGWKAGYSDDELKQLLERHKDEGWHIREKQRIAMQLKEIVVMDGILNVIVKTMQMQKHS